MVRQGPSWVGGAASICYLTYPPNSHPTRLVRCTAQLAKGARRRRGHPVGKWRQRRKRAIPRHKRACQTLISRPPRPPPSHPIEAVQRVNVLCKSAVVIQGASFLFPFSLFCVFSLSSWPSLHSWSLPVPARCVDACALAFFSISPVDDPVPLPAARLSPLLPAPRADSPLYTFFPPFPRVTDSVGSKHPTPFFFSISFFCASAFRIVLCGFLSSLHREFYRPPPAEH